MITATRRLQFCAGHRVHKHESKCSNMHGHNYVLEFTARGTAAGALDRLGRVIDFGVMKEKLGPWIETYWDHGFIYHTKDSELWSFFSGNTQHKSYALPLNPTAENMAYYLLHNVCPGLFENTGVEIIKIVLHETENCKVEVTK